RVALCIHAQAQFWKLLRYERMRPMVHKGQAWSMNQFLKLFNTCRIPMSECDQIRHCFHTRRLDKLLPACRRTPTNIIILFHGHIFSINAIHSPKEDSEKVVDDDKD